MNSLTEYTLDCSPAERYMGRRCAPGVATLTLTIDVDEPTIIRILDLAKAAKSVNFGRIRLDLMLGALSGTKGPIADGSRSDGRDG